MGSSTLFINFIAYSYHVDRESFLHLSVSCFACKCVWSSVCVCFMSRRRIAFPFFKFRIQSFFFRMYQRWLRSMLGRKTQMGAEQLHHVIARSFVMTLLRNWAFLKRFTCFECCVVVTQQYKQVGVSFILGFVLLSERCE